MALAPRARHEYSDWKKHVMRRCALCHDLSSLHSHCTAEMLTAPSNVPARNGMPWPMSCKKRSPSTSRSLATPAFAREMAVEFKNTSQHAIRASIAYCCHYGWYEKRMERTMGGARETSHAPSMDGLMSRPTHVCPRSLITSPLRPEPQPMSSSKHDLSAGKLSRSTARSDMRL